jgi:hypothetical protein
MLVLVLILVSAIAVYLGSCMLHPYVACETCEGKGKHSGALFTKASRPCHACSGAGQKQRAGAVLLSRGKRRKSTSRIAPRTSSIKTTE